MLALRTTLTRAPARRGLRTYTTEGPAPKPKKGEVTPEQEAKFTARRAEEMREKSLRPTIPLKQRFGFTTEDARGWITVGTLFMLTMAVHTMGVKKEAEFKLAQARKDLKKLQVEIAHYQEECVYRDDVEEAATRAGLERGDVDKLVVAIAECPPVDYKEKTAERLRTNLTTEIPAAVKRGEIELSKDEPVSVKPVPVTPESTPSAPLVNPNRVV